MFVDPEEDTLEPGSEAAAFYAQLGRAIAQWAEIEGYLFELLVFALGADRYKCALVFEKLGTTGPVLDKVDHLLSISLDDSWYQKWRPIYVEIKTLVNFRNNLAHNPVGRIVWGSTSGQSGFNYYSYLDQRKLSLSENWTADVNEIKRHNQKISFLRHQIRSLGIPASARRPSATPTPPRFPLDLTPPRPKHR